MFRPACLILCRLCPECSVLVFVLWETRPVGRWWCVSVPLAFSQSPAKLRSNWGFCCVVCVYSQVRTWVRVSQPLWRHTSVVSKSCLENVRGGCWLKKEITCLTLKVFMRFNGLNIPHKREKAAVNNNLVCVLQIPAPCCLTAVPAASLPVDMTHASIATVCSGRVVSQIAERGS